MINYELLYLPKQKTIQNLRWPLY